MEQSLVNLIINNLKDKVIINEQTQEEVISIKDLEEILKKIPSIKPIYSDKNCLLLTFPRETPNEEISTILRDIKEQTGVYCIALRDSVEVQATEIVDLIYYLEDLVTPGLISN